MSEPVTGAVAAPKRTVIKLTDIERMVYDRCLVTGDTPDEATTNDRVMMESLMRQALKNTRKTVIEEKLNQSPVWLKQQIQKLKAGVREPCDEPGWVKDESRVSSLHKEEALRRMQSGAEELHGAPDA